MDVIGAKVLAGFLLFALALVCGCVPYWCFTCCFRRRGTGGLQRTDTRRIFLLQCLHAMSSGVLIGTCLLHLLPESLEVVREAMSAKHNKNEILLESNTTSSNSTPVGMKNSVHGEDHFDENHYPFGELLAALGFMCVFMVDSGIKSWSESKNRGSNIFHDRNDDDVVFLWTDQINSSLHKEVKRARAPNKESGHTDGQWIEWLRSKLSKSETPYRPVQQIDRELDHENMLMDTDVPDYNYIDLRQSTTDVPDYNYIDLRQSTTNVPDYKYTDPRQPQTGSGGVVDVTTPLDLRVVRSRASRHERQEGGKSNHLRSVALVAALCIHAFFDGLMMGLQTSMAVIMSLLFAISLHKSFVAVGLSLNLLSRNQNNLSALRIVLLVIMFAASSPIGVLVSGVFLHGTVGVSSSEQTNIVSGCLQSFAVGTFMYVTFTETTERRHQRALSTDVISHVFLLLGFGFMAGLRAVVRDD